MTHTARFCLGLAVVAAATVSAPVSLPAQQEPGAPLDGSRVATSGSSDLVCGWNTFGPRDLDGIHIFRGGYEVARVEVDSGECSGSDCEFMLQHLERIALPRGIGPSRSFWGTSNYTTRLGNLLVNNNRGALFVEWGSPGSFGPVPIQWDGHLMREDTHMWCVRDDPARAPGQFYLRAGVARDLRWGPEDANLIEGIGNLLGLSEDKVYIGPGGSRSRQESHTWPVVGYTTPGFPVVEWGLHPHAESDARLFTQRFFEDGDSRYGQNFTTWEFELWGSIEREMRTLTDCSGWWFWEDCDEVRSPAYTRWLGGEVRVTSYLDHRLGFDDVEPTRSTVQLRVYFRGETIFSSDHDTNLAMARRVERFCGTQDGCGSIPRRPAAGSDDPFGFTLANDLQEQSDQLCGAMLEQAGVLAAACDSTNNPYIPDTEIDEGAVERELTRRPPESPDLTDEERSRIREGERTIAGESYKLPGQRERTCLARAQQDSSEIANAPIPVDATPPPSVPTDVLYNICAAEYGIAPREGAPTPTLDSNRCFTYNRRTYCIR